MKPLIIAETAYNHEGDYEYLVKMTKEIGDLGIQAIKYHLLLDVSSYMVQTHPLFETIKKWMFSIEQWIKIFHIAQEYNLNIVALCDDVESLKFINEKFSDIFAIELHATSINDYHLLNEASRFPGKVILGTGGSTLDEISYAIDFLRKKGKDDILLMYGFQSYPTDYAEINLKKMAKLHDLFGLPVGYADHTSFDDPNNVIVSCMGMFFSISILEKHYTLDYGVERIDYHAAVGKDQMREIQKLMELALLVIGDGSLAMSIAEKKYGNIGPMKKAIVAGDDIDRGTLLTTDNMVFKRTEEESPLCQSDFDMICGLKTLRNLKKDDIITFCDVEYTFKKSRTEDYTNIKR